MICTKRITALFLVLLITAIVSVTVFAEYTVGESILMIDFEDGTLGGFFGRGGTEILEVSSEEAFGGQYSLKVTGRTESWHAPAVRVDGYITVGKEYVVSVMVLPITPSVSNFRLSAQIGEEESAKYENMASRTVVAGSGWVELTGTCQWGGKSGGYLSIYIENDTPDAEYYIDNLLISEIEDTQPSPDLSEVYRSGRGMSARAAYGTPVIDGQIDKIWDSTDTLIINKMLQRQETAKGTAKVLWDEEYLYVMIKVADPVLNSSSLVVHECDSIEAFVCENNSKRGIYKKGDGQYRVDINNFVSSNESTDLTGFESAVAIISSGYVVEMKIPWKVIRPESGMAIGFDAQINDAENGMRIGIAKWSDPTNESYIDTSKWGGIMLVNEIPHEASNPVYIWIIIAISLVAFAAAGSGVLVFAKRKKK